MFQGLRTVIYHVENLEEAKDWYAQALKIKPYFDKPFYVGFNVGGYELGLDPDMTGVRKGSAGVVYWGVPDAKAAFKRLVEMGAKVDGTVQEVGDDIKVATLTDPFGNVLGIIENPNFETGE
jgi:predicted enzyme related to lactoylglutathione lyase